MGQILKILNYLLIKSLTKGFTTNPSLMRKSGVSDYKNLIEAQNGKSKTNIFRSICR